jgi:hypothetical protein
MHCARFFYASTSTGLFIHVFCQDSPAETGSEPRAALQQPGVLNIRPCPTSLSKGPLGSFKQTWASYFQKVTSVDLVPLMGQNKR